MANGLGLFIYDDGPRFNESLIDYSFFGYVRYRDGWYA